MLDWACFLDRPRLGPLATSPELVDLEPASWAMSRVVFLKRGRGPATVLVGTPQSQSTFATQRTV
jgi:hypothetical protein